MNGALLSAGGIQGPHLRSAVDIGSTTIAAHLCNLQDEVLVSSGAMNPQIRWRRPHEPRVYVMMNLGGDADMTAAVRRLSISWRTTSR